MGSKVVLFIALSAFAWAVSVEQAAARVEQLSSQAPQGLRLQFRILAAQALKDRHPELARKFVLASIEDVRDGDAVNLLLLDTLAAVAPEETIALLPRLRAGSDLDVGAAFMRTNQPLRAVPVYRSYFKKGHASVDLAALFTRLGKESPEDAKSLFADMLAAFSYVSATPRELYDLTNSAAAIAPLAPAMAATVFDRVLTIASAPDYAKSETRALIGTFQIGAVEIKTTSSRETLLVAAGARACTQAPDIFEKYKAFLAPWDLSRAFKSGRANFSAPAETSRIQAEVAIFDRIGKLRGMADAERPAEILHLAMAIEALPERSKLGWAIDLANFASEGDNGKKAMKAVVAVLADGIRQGTPGADEYIELASLIRYEHVRAPFADVTLDTADAILALRESVLQDATFTLTAMDGKTYSLPELRGKVVLLNFWATWCPPCRKEMPDMEALYHRLAKKGLVVLAVSNEDRETVLGFLAKQNYTFPVLLDPDRKVNDAFGIEGIPKSFIFNREGKLVALAMDMRTERQFLELLKQAGL